MSCISPRIIDKNFRLEGEVTVPYKKDIRGRSNCTDPHNSCYNTHTVFSIDELYSTQLTIVHLLGIKHCYCCYYY